MGKISNKKSLKCNNDKKIINLNTAVMPWGNFKKKKFAEIFYFHFMHSFWYWLHSMCYEQKVCVAIFLLNGHNQTRFLTPQSGKNLDRFYKRKEVRVAWVKRLSFLVLEVRKSVNKLDPFWVVDAFSKLFFLWQTRCHWCKFLKRPTIKLLDDTLIAVSSLR